MPTRSAAPLTVSSEQRQVLEAMARSTRLPRRVVTQSHALLWAADGISNEEIARRSGVAGDTVRRWRTRFSERGVVAVGQIEKGRGRKPRLGEGIAEEVLRVTLGETPPGGATHWTTRSMAQRVGIGKDSVARIWAQHSIGARRALDTPAQLDLDASVQPKGTLNETRWSEILKVAEEVLSEKGYKDATIQDIASRVGLLKGSLYYYIQNKEDLLCQVLRRANARYLQRLQEDPRISEGDAVCRLSHFIDRHMHQLYRDRPWNGLDERDHVFLDPDRLASINAIRHQIQLLLKGILTDGIAEGAFEPNMDPSVTANSIISLMNTTLRWYRTGGRYSIPEIGEWYKHFILRGLVRPPVR
jgi:AcrR family transcriptional regulator/transposase